MMKLVCLITALVVSGLTGCGYTGTSEVEINPREKLLSTAISKKDWSDAFFYYSLIVQYGSKNEVSTATISVERQPEIAQAGLNAFSKNKLSEMIKRDGEVNSAYRQHINALCKIVSVKECEIASNNLITASDSVNSRLLLVKSAFDKLTAKEKKLLQEKYDITFVTDVNVGIIKDRQVVNRSIAGSSTGSEVGSSLASAIYINDAVSNNSYNMWTDISVGVVGGIVGASANRKPQEKYIVAYTIRNFGGDLQTASVEQESPIGAGIGECFDFIKKNVISSDICAMTPASIRKDYL